MLCRSQGTKEESEDSRTAGHQRSLSDELGGRRPIRVRVEWKYAQRGRVTAGNWVTAAEPPNC